MRLSWMMPSSVLVSAHHGTVLNRLRRLFPLHHLLKRGLVSSPCWRSSSIAVLVETSVVCNRLLSLTKLIEHCYPCPEKRVSLCRTISHYGQRMRFGLSIMAIGRHSPS